MELAPVDDYISSQRICDQNKILENTKVNEGVDKSISKTSALSAVILTHVHFMDASIPMITYCPRRNQWTPAEKLFNLPRPLDVTKKMVILNEKIFMLNRYEIHVFDRLEQTPHIDAISLPKLACLADFCVLHGKLYVFATYNGENFNVTRYDPETRTWNNVTPMPYNNFEFGVAALGDHLYVVGGNYGKLGRKRRLNQKHVQCYDPRLNIWTHSASMNVARSSPLVSVLNGLLYAIGGFNYDDWGFPKRLQSVERYDPSEDKWTVIASLNSLMGLVGVGAWDSNSLIVLGETDAEKYDSEADKWTAIQIPKESKYIGLLENVPEKFINPYQP